MPTLTKVPPGVIAPVKPKAAEIIRATGSDVTHVWGAGPEKDHNNLRCVDFMVTRPGDGRPAATVMAAGNRVAAYVWRHRVRLGVRLIIWRSRIISTYRSSGGRPAGVWGRYSGPNPHNDHPHVEFDDSPYRPLPGGTPKPTPSKPSTVRADRWVVTAKELFYWSQAGAKGTRRGLVKRGRKLQITESRVLTRNGRREGWIRTKYGNWFCAYQGADIYAKRS